MINKTRTSTIKAALLRYREIKSRNGSSYARSVLMKKLWSVIATLLISPLIKLKGLLQNQNNVQKNRKDTQISLNTNNTKKGIKIFFVVGGYMSAGGGHRNIIRLAYYLENFGYDVTIGVSDIAFGDSKISKYVRSLYPFSGEVFRLNRGARKFHADVAIATQWQTVEIVKEQFGPQTKRVYLVQDLEYLFYPMGDNYLAAEDTYRQGFFHICSGPWCKAKLIKKYNAVAEYFEFPVDKNIYNDNQEKERFKNRIVFFAKPEMPRRCFSLGVKALSILAKKLPNIEIVMFGSKDISQFNFDFNYIDLSILPTIEDLADLYRSGTIGLAFSTTNPSLVPYEMLACGLVVVDLKFDNSEINYGGNEDSVLLADPFPEAIANKIFKALSLSDSELTARRQKGFDLVNRFPSEMETAKVFEQHILKAIS